MKLEIINDTVIVGINMPIGASSSRMPIVGYIGTPSKVKPIWSTAIKNAKYMNSLITTSPYAEITAKNYLNSNMLDP